MKRRFPVADGDVQINGCLIDVDRENGRATDFKLISVAKSQE